MESLIGLVNRIQRACTVLGDHGGEGMSLWEALPSVAVVGGQVSAILLLAFRFLFLNFRGLISFLLTFIVIHVLNEKIRALGSRLCWKAWLEGTSCLVDPVVS